MFFIDTFSKHAWVVPLKYKKGLTLADAFRKILNNSTRKPNKIRVGKSSEFDNSSFKHWLKYNDIEMYSTHTEGKSVVAERFIRTLKNKIDKHLTSVSKYVNDKNHVRKSKYKNIFTKGYTPHWSEEVFVIKDVKNIVPWTCY